MRDREKDMGRESEEGKQREKVRERNGNEETKSVDLEHAGSKDGFLADTSNCTGSITTKALDHIRLYTPSVTHTQGKCLLHIYKMTLYAWQVGTERMQPPV